jgi:hypothetical protein
MDDAHLDPESLRLFVKQVDKDYPWISRYVGGEIAPSIRWMGEVEMRDKSAWTDRNYKIEIRPSFMLKAEQFYAYHRYLRCLAEKLAAMGIDGVHTVSSWMDINGGGSGYLTPAALDGLEEIMRQPAAQELKALMQRALG